MDFDGRFGGGFGFFHIIGALAWWTFTIIVVLAVATILFLLGRFLIAGTKAANLYIARHTQQPAPSGPAAPAADVPAEAASAAAATKPAAKAPKAAPPTKPVPTTDEAATTELPSTKPARTRAPKTPPVEPAP
ncbi:MAG TPA: hypothetical protein VN200_05880 [Rhodoglobus sp.]|nr:hypothetical protein [Rhodoglobus sp.]